MQPQGSASPALSATPAFYDRPGGFQTHMHRSTLPSIAPTPQQPPIRKLAPGGRPPSGGARLPPIGLPAANRPSSASASRNPTGLPVAPDPTELLEFARYLGLDPIYEMKFAWVAAEAMTAPLPEPWEEYSSDKGIFYYNPVTDVSTFEHPADEKYRGILASLRALEKDRNVRMRDQRATGIRQPPKQAPAAPGWPPVTPEETQAMAEYLGIDPKREPVLCWVAREAAAAALPHDWIEVADPDGSPVFYNTQSGDASREHPEDKRFRVALSEERSRLLAGLPSQGPFQDAWARRRATQGWFDFIDLEGAPFSYNFITGQRTYSVAGRMADTAAARIQAVWRRHIAQLDRDDLRTLHGMAAVLQAAARRRIAIRAAHALRMFDAAARAIQSLYRSHLARTLKEVLRSQDEYTRQYAAQHYAQLARCATIVQAAYRTRLARRAREALRQLRSERAAEARATAARLAAQTAAGREEAASLAAAAEAEERAVREEEARLAAEEARLQRRAVSRAKKRKPRPLPAPGKAGGVAAVRIQCAFRRLLARRAFLSLRLVAARRQRLAAAAAGRPASQGAARPGSQAGSRPSSRPAGLYVDPGTPEWAAARKIQTLYRSAMCWRLLARYRAVLEAERYLPGGDIYSATLLQAVARRYLVSAHAGTPQRPRSAASAGSGGRRHAEEDRRRAEQAAARRDIAQAASSLAARAGAGKPGTAVGGARARGSRGGTPSEVARRAAPQLSAAEEFEQAMAEAAALLRRRAQDDAGRAEEVARRRAELEAAKRELARRRAEAERRKRRAEEGRALLAAQEAALRAGDEAGFRAALDAMQGGAATIVQAAFRRRLADRRADEAAIACLAEVGAAALFPPLALARAEARIAGVPRAAALAAMGAAVARHRGAAVAQAAYRRHIARRLRRALAEAAAAERLERRANGAVLAIQAVWRRAGARRRRRRYARIYERIIQNVAARCIQAACRARMYRELRRVRRAEMSHAIEAHRAAALIQACVRGRLARVGALAAMRYREYEVEARARLLFGEEGEELHRSRLEALWAPHDVDTGRFIYDALNQLAEGGRWGECVDVLEEILRQRVQQFGTYHAETHRAAETVALAGNSFAVRCLRLGRPAEALSLLRKAALHTERDRMLYPLRAELRAVTMDNLANYYYTRGKCSAALEFSEKGLRVGRRCEGRQLYSVCLGELHVAAVLGRLRRHEEAVGHARAALDAFLVETVNWQFMCDLSEYGPGWRSPCPPGAAHAWVAALVYHNIAVEQVSLMQVRPALEVAAKALHVVHGTMAPGHPWLRAFEKAFLYCRMALFHSIHPKTLAVRRAEPVRSKTASQLHGPTFPAAARLLPGPVGPLRHSKSGPAGLPRPGAGSPPPAPAPAPATTKALLRESNSLPALRGPSAVPTLPRIQEKPRRPQAWAE